MHVLEMFDLRFAVSGPEHGHEVEAGRVVFGAMLLEVVTCGAFDTAPFDHAGRIHEIGVLVGSARLHLDEDNGVVIERNEVDLTDWALVVARKNAVPASAQMTRRDPLTARA